MDKQIIGGEVVVGGNKIPLSKAIRAGDYVYLSGQVPLKSDGSVETGSIEAQTRVVMENIKEILGDAGCGSPMSSRPRHGSRTVPTLPDSIVSTPSTSPMRPPPVPRWRVV